MFKIYYLDICYQPDILEIEVDNCIQLVPIGTKAKS